MPDGSYHPYPHRDEACFGVRADARAPQHDESNPRSDISNPTTSSHGAAKQPRPGDPYDVEKKDGSPGRATRAPEDDGRSIGSAATGEKSGARAGGITGKITGPITGPEDALRAHQPIDASLKSDLRNSARIFLPERGRSAYARAPADNVRTQTRRSFSEGGPARLHASFDSHAGKMPALRQEADCSNFISPPPLGRDDIERLNGAE